MKHPRRLRKTGIRLRESGIRLAANHIGAGQACVDRALDRPRGGERKKHDPRRSVDTVQFRVIRNHSSARIRVRVQTVPVSSPDSQRDAQPEERRRRIAGDRRWCDVHANQGQKPLPQGRLAQLGPACPLGGFEHLRCGGRGIFIRTVCHDRTHGLTQSDLARQRNIEGLRSIVGDVGNDGDVTAQAPSLVAAKFSGRKDRIVTGHVQAMQ